MHAVAASGGHQKAAIRYADSLSLLDQVVKPASEGFDRLPCHKLARKRASDAPQTHCGETLMNSPG